MFTFTAQYPLILESANALPLRLSYHIFGDISSNKPLVWVCHALTGSSNVWDWWAGLFGEDKLFNPLEFTVICVNIPGSPYGSIHPLDTDENGHKWYDDFPLITTRDAANAFELLRQNLQINKIDLLIGASLGGQIALEWSIINSVAIQKLVLVASNAFHSPWGIAFNESQRLSIQVDPTFAQKSVEGGKNGLIAARSLAMLSYRSPSAYNSAQADNNDNVDQFKAASYQRYQGWKLTQRFNAYSYVALTRMMDSHHIGRTRIKDHNRFSACQQVLRNLNIPTTIIGIDSDLLFPLTEQQFIADHLPSAQLLTIHSIYGHDAFLIEYEQLIYLFKTHILL
jgi:homoserine O-acetyltransferase/O-succinyltransferase